MSAGLSAHPSWTRWGAHVAFWGVYFGLRTAAAAADPPTEWGGFPFIVNRALSVSTYFILTGALLALVAGPLATRSDRGRNLGLVLGAIALAPLTQLGEQFWPFMLEGDATWSEFWSGLLANYSPTSFAAYFFQFGWALPLWGLMQALMGYHFETVAQARAIARAQALAYDAQLRMLHYQINPHFLFNTLNAISSLVLDGRTQQAENMLMRLSGFLRYSLDRQPNEVTKLSAELEAQRKYLEIEQTRFGDKLAVRFTIEPGLEEARVPSLILQPILENAIKHAITPRVDGGRIDVSAAREGDILRICVEDDGPGLPSAAAPGGRRGLGLANARERLELMYGDRAGLSAHNRTPNGCRVELWLPLEENRVGRQFASTVG